MDEKSIKSYYRVKRGLREQSDVDAKKLNVGHQRSSLNPARGRIECLCCQLQINFSGRSLFVVLCASSSVSGYQCLTQVPINVMPKYRLVTGIGASVLTLYQQEHIIELSHSSVVWLMFPAGTNVKWHWACPGLGWVTTRCQGHLLK